MYTSAVAALSADERELDLEAPSVAVPRPEVQLAVRFGPAVRSGLDVHAVGGRQKVHRKLVRRGQRVVMVRLPLGRAQAVLGVPASALVERVVALDELWSDATTRRLVERLADARDTSAAATLLQDAIAERVDLASRPSPHAQLAIAAADRLASASVRAVAADLGVSERHLRRVFHETMGLNPKEFAKLTRFHRALGAARADGRRGWARIATESGYYDQAHLIAEFNAIAGATPRALLDEILTAPCVL